MKKSLAAITMALVLGCSTVFADGGIIIGDRGGIIIGDRSTRSDSCLASKEGIIIGDRSGILGGLWAALGGIIIGDRGSAPCTTTKDGVVSSNLGGIIIGD